MKKSNQRKKRTFAVMRSRIAMSDLSVRMFQKSDFSHSFTAISVIFLVFAILLQPIRGKIMAGFREFHDAIQETSRDDLGQIVS